MDGRIKKQAFSFQRSALSFRSSEVTQVADNQKADADVSKYEKHSQG
jgi:hypothetical protein